MSKQVKVHLDSHKLKDDENPRLDATFKDGEIRIEAWLPEGDTRNRQAHVLAHQLAQVLQAASAAQDVHQGIVRPSVTVGGTEVLTSRSA